MLENITTTKVEDKIKELKEKGKVIPGIDDVVFKRIMMDHKDYLAKILNELMIIDEEIKEEEIVFIKNEFPPHDYHIHLICLLYFLHHFQSIRFLVFP